MPMPGRRPSSPRKRSFVASSSSSRWVSVVASGERRDRTVPLSEYLEAIRRWVSLTRSSVTGIVEAERFDRFRGEDGLPSTGGEDMDALLTSSAAIKEAAHFEHAGQALLEDVSERSGATKYGIAVGQGEPGIG